MQHTYLKFLQCILIGMHIRIILIILGGKCTSDIRNNTDACKYGNAQMQCYICTHVHSIIMHVHLSTHFTNMRVLTNITHMHYMSRGGCMCNTYSKHCSHVNFYIDKPNKLFLCMWFLFKAFITTVYHNISAS